jgi:hypothetical protein
VGVGVEQAMAGVVVVMTGVPGVIAVALRRPVCVTLMAVVAAVVLVVSVLVVPVVLGLVGVTGAIEAGVIADQSPMTALNLALSGSVWTGMVMPGMVMLMAVATVAVLGVRIAVHFVEYKSFGLAHCI